MIIEELSPEAIAMELLGFLEPAILNPGVKWLSKVRKDTRLAWKWIGAFDH